MPPTFDRLTEAMAHEAGIAALDFTPEATDADLKAALAVALLESIIVLDGGSITDVYNLIDAADTYMLGNGRYEALKRDLDAAEQSCECEACIGVPTGMWTLGVN